MNPLWLYTPLLTALIVGLLNKRLSHTFAQLITVSGLIISFIVSCIIANDVLFNNLIYTIRIDNWIDLIDFNIKWAMHVDSIVAIMLIVVTSVSLLVHVYSIGYMHDDPDVPRFMSYLSLFTFAMLMLVTSSNLLQLFFGWEGVGVCSYLLIGFWYKKPSATQAAIKAFLVNRVGDLCFIIGIAALYNLTGTIKIKEIFQNLSLLSTQPIAIMGSSFNAIDFIGIFLFLGCMGKSAQIGLHVWLPDAMEGPTPVSALIHAATMVTAGVFLVVRLNPLFELSEITRDFILIIGTITAFFAASIALVQNDIKKIIAYSTCSQLGYMFIACGLSAYNVALFHLATHAFFKALLFLSAGSVIHSVSGEQDINKMGNLWKKIPITYLMFWIGSLAIAGFPPFAGFYSKDAILESAFMTNSTLGNIAFYVGVISASFTTFYSWRLIFKVFHGKANYNLETSSHIHESPLVMLIPLILLSIGAIYSGYYGYHNLNILDASLKIWNGAIAILPEHNILEQIHHTPIWAKNLPLVLGIIAIILAYIMYVSWPKIADKMADNFRFIHNLLFNKYYFDQIYNSLIVKNYFKISSFNWKVVDIAIIDKLGPNGVISVVKFIATKFSKYQNGYLYTYALTMLSGVILIISWYVFKLVQL